MDKGSTRIILIALIFVICSIVMTLYMKEGNNQITDPIIVIDEVDDSDSEINQVHDENSVLFDYNGIYYLHDDLPEHGQDIGNTHDVGDLLRIEPHGNEERYCAKWVQFDFDEHIFGETTGDKSFFIENVYFHIWWKSANDMAKIGIDPNGNYDFSVANSITITNADSVATMEKNGYWLTVNTINVNCLIEDIHNMAIKLVSIDAVPSVYSGINQYSFIIINLESEEILKTQDRDSDGLKDFEELFTYYTNPYDPDTDSDGLNDLEEIENGYDGYITEPNNFDTDNDNIIDKSDKNPLATDFKIINNDWIVEKREIITNECLDVKGNIIIKTGGKLDLIDSVLKMNQNGEKYRILVEKNGELNIIGCSLITDDPDHWYRMTLDTEHWHEERTIEIYGKAVIRDSVIDYGSIIYIRSSNDTELSGNLISHYYYGVFCSYSNPVINYNYISPFIGNGIFLWHSSPLIENTIIIAYIGSGISCYYSSPIIKNCKISAGSNDIFLDGDSHPLLTNSEFSNNMVHVGDDESSVLIGEFEEKEYGEHEETQIQSDDSNLRLFSSILLVIALIFGIFLVLGKFNFSPIKGDNGNVNKTHSQTNFREGPKSKKERILEKQEKKRRKIRPRRSWK
jgi:hypothetical protein